MLTVQQCRAALGGRQDLTDNEIRRLRDQLYAIAEVAVDNFKTQQDRQRDVADHAGSGRDEVSRERALKLIHGDDRQTFEERAAILEYDGGLDRDVAERRAALHIVSRDSK